MSNRPGLAMPLIAAALTLASGVGAAQPAVPPANEAVTSPVDCAPKAALYAAGKSAKVWMIRQGTMVLAENPLRPMSQDAAIVLDVVVNGRRATAFGSDLDHLRQGGTIKSVERQGREPVHWSEAAIAPASIRVVAEDGRVLLGPLPFGGCENPPASKAVVDAPVKRERPARTAKEGAASDDALPKPLPQGAIDGLALPKAGARR